MLAPFLHENLLEAGCDEAGRGCLAGPVFAAAVILPKDFYHEKLNDSKQVDEPTRRLLRPIIEREAIAFAVAQLPPATIDKINILNASIASMQLALDGLRVRPEFILIDGNRFKPYRDIPYQTVVKGDSKFASIAAASILAKTYRDECMEALHQEFPQYSWLTNKGYPTIAHRKAIAEIGSCEHHRLSFQLLPLPKQTELDLK